MPSAIQHSEATLRRRRRLSLTWAGLAISWALVRATVAWAVLGDYGLNPWIYLAIDLASACIDAYTTPRMVISFVDRQYKQAVIWATASLVVFIIPDLYLFVGTGRLPHRVIFIMVGIITLTFSLAVLSVVRKVRQARRDRAAAQMRSRPGQA